MPQCLWQQRRGSKFHLNESTTRYVNSYLIGVRIVWLLLTTSTASYYHHCKYYVFATTTTAVKNAVPFLEKDGFGGCNLSVLKHSHVSTRVQVVQWFRAFAAMVMLQARTLVRVPPTTSEFFRLFFLTKFLHSTIKPQR